MIKYNLSFLNKQLFKNSLVCHYCGYCTSRTANTASNKENPITLFHCKSSSSPRIPSIRPLDNPYSRCNVQSTTTNRIQIEVTSIWRVRSERAKDSLSTELITLLISTSWRCSWGSILHIHRKCKLCIASWRAPNKKNAFSTRSSV